MALYRRAVRADALEIELSAQGIAVDPRELQAEWQATVRAALSDAGLQIPEEAPFRHGGKQGCTASISGRCWRRCSIYSAPIPVSVGSRRDYATSG